MVTIRAPATAGFSTSIAPDPVTRTRSGRGASPSALLACAKRPAPAGQIDAASNESAPALRNVSAPTTIALAQARSMPMTKRSPASCPLMMPPDSSCTGSATTPSTDVTKLAISRGARKPSGPPYAAASGPGRSHAGRSGRSKSRSS